MRDLSQLYGWSVVGRPFLIDVRLNSVNHYQMWSSHPYPTDAHQAVDWSAFHSFEVLYELIHANWTDPFLIYHKSQYGISILPEQCFPFMAVMLDLAYLDEYKDMHLLYLDYLLLSETTGGEKFWFLGILFFQILIRASISLATICCFLKFGHKTLSSTFTAPLFFKRDIPLYKGIPF